MHARTTTFRSRRSLCVGAAIITALLAACGSGGTNPFSGGTTRQANLAGSASSGSASPGSTSPGSTPSSSTPSSSASPPGSTGSGSFSMIGCPSAAAVSAAMGATYPAPQVSSSDSKGNYECNYSGSDNSTEVTILINPGYNAASFASTIQDADTTASEVSPVYGLGNAAYFDPAISGVGAAVFVLSGSEVITVSSYGGTAAQLEGVARAAMGG
jgi:hypothetical protein